MVEEPESENSLFSEPMKMRTPSARSARPSRSITSRLRLEIVEQEPYALEILERLEVLEQVGLAAHDQLALVGLAAGPAGEPGGDRPLRQLVELGLRRPRARCSSSASRLRQRAAADAGVEEVRGLDQRRRSAARRAD